MKAEILATGTELLLGQTLNTSVYYLTGKLSSLGIEVDYHITVGDNPERIEDSLRQALGRSELVVTTGGLGPTVDDLTKELTAKVLGLEMELDQASLKHVEDFFALRKAKMSENDRKQAYFPKGAIILPNTIGTAPGAIISKNGKTVVILPGPPIEMQPMYEHYVHRELEKIVGPDAGRMNVRVLKVFGMGESAIEEIIADLMGKPNPTIALLAKHSEFHIRLVARSADAKEARNILDQAEEEIRSRLGDRVFGRDEDSMIGIVSKALREQGITVATAESCTGGLVGAALTQEPGSSNFYLGGVVSYDNLVKETMLGVKRQSLEKYGAVSQEVAIEMASGARDRLGTDLALATTGIAGPDGGSDLKPVGLVYIGLATPQGVKAKKFQFYGGRDSVRALSVQAALNWLRLYLFNLKGDFTN